MATVTKPIALDESLNTTEQSSRNIADVLAQEIGNLVTVVSRIAPSTTVSWNQIQQSGTKIAQITINGTSTDVYAPTGGGGFSALIIITADAGQTVTATKGGDTYTATEVTSGTYEVTVDSAGTWTISDGTISDTIAIPSSGTYYVTLSSVPDGKTVTPTDDVQILLACAGITDKSYTMISELLADSVSLATVISDNNAIDYLVRSTTWASSVTSDSTAMSYIGLNNYASNTLLADSTWCNAICNSTYFESVLNVKVPTMTSNTTPSGECIASGSFSELYQAYKAFDGVDTGNDKWVSQNNSPWWLGYIFTSDVNIKGVYISNETGTYSDQGVKTLKVQYSTDNGLTWADASENITVTQGGSIISAINGSPTDTKYWRVLCIDGYNIPSYNRVSILEIQFYGRADV